MDPLSEVLSVRYARAAVGCGSTTFHVEAAGLRSCKFSVAISRASPTEPRASSGHLRDPGVSAALAAHSQTA